MRDYSREDREVRERLERNSLPGERANVVGRLNLVSENDVVLQRAAALVLDGLRKGAQGRARTLSERNARFEALLASGALTKAEPYVSSLRVAKVPDAGGRVRGEAGRLQPSGEPSDAMTVLSVADMRHLINARYRSRFF